MRLEIDKERFKQYLEQFIGDAPYQIDLVKTLLSQMPPKVKDALIEDLYFNDIYIGVVYKIQHATFQDDIHYFPNVESMEKYFRENCFYQDEHVFDKFDKILVDRHCLNGKTFLGYKISKEGWKYDRQY